MKKFLVLGWLAFALSTLSVAPVLFLPAPAHAAPCNYTEWIPGEIRYDAGSNNCYRAQVNASGQLVITGSGSGGTFTATGDSLSGAADSGTGPVKIGGVVIPGSVLPTFTGGQRANAQTDTKGRIFVSIAGPQSADFDAYTNSGMVGLNGLDGGATGTFALKVYPAVFNGTDWDRQRGDTTGLAIMPYGLTARRWSYAAAASGIVNTTTAVTVKTAAGAGLRNCIAAVQINTDTLGAATEAAFRDGAAGTVLWRIKLGTAAQPGVSYTLPAAVCGTANTLLEFVTLTASITGAVYVNVQGPIEP